jgi:hypothetical protein
VQELEELSSQFINFFELAAESHLTLSPGRKLNEEYSISKHEKNFSTKTKTFKFPDDPEEKNNCFMILETIRNAIMLVYRWNASNLLIF